LHQHDQNLGNAGAVGHRYRGEVTDTINVYFVKVRLNKDGKTTTGYTDRRCFGVRGSK